MNFSIFSVFSHKKDGICDKNTYFFDLIINETAFIELIGKNPKFLNIF